VTDGGTIKLFETHDEARREAVLFVPDATVLHACTFQRTLRESINCAGIHAAKMGLNKPNVHIDGLKIGPNPPPAFLQKAREKEGGGGA
jgi:hypothetical protein